MNMNIQDKTGEPRSQEELVEAKVAIMNRLITDIDPIMVYYPTIVDAINELLTLRNRAMAYKHLLQNILAIIHRDGGHYTQAHGIEKSIEDAINKIAEERLQLEIYKSSAKTCR